MQILRLLFLRLASAIPVVLVVVTVVFLLVRLTGDPATILAGDMASPEVVASVRADLGLDRPCWASMPNGCGICCRATSAHPSSPSSPWRR